MKQLKSWKKKIKKIFKNKYLRNIYLQAIGLFILFAIPVIVISILFHKPIELVFLFVSFVGLRYTFPKTFHSTKYKCIFYSIMMFTGMLFIVLPITLSLISSVFVACFSCYILYVIKDYQDLKEKSAKTLKEMTQEEFEQHCKHKNLTIQETMIADCIYRQDLKGETLYNTIGYSRRQSKRIRKTIRKKLEN